MGWICSCGFRVDEGSSGEGGSLGLGCKGKEGTLARWVELPITGEEERVQSSDTNILFPVKKQWNVYWYYRFFSDAERSTFLYFILDHHWSLFYGSVMLSHYQRNWNMVKNLNIYRGLRHLDVPLGLIYIWYFLTVHHPQIEGYTEELN